MSPAWSRECHWQRDKPLVEKGWITLQQGDIDTKSFRHSRPRSAWRNFEFINQQQSLIALQQQEKDYQESGGPLRRCRYPAQYRCRQPGAGRATGTFMFTVMQTEIIRTQVYAPQDQAFGVAPGVEAVVRVPELPNRSFPGKVTRIADALEPKPGRC